MKVKCKNRDEAVYLEQKCFKFWQQLNPTSQAKCYQPVPETLPVTVDAKTPSPTEWEVFIEPSVLPAYVEFLAEKIAALEKAKEVKA